MESRRAGCRWKRKTRPVRGYSVTRFFLGIKVGGSSEIVALNSLGLVPFSGLCVTGG